MSRRRVVAALAAVLALAAVGAEPALASEPIESLAVSSSTSQAGGHPDLDMSFSLASPGAPESAQDVAVNTPAGVFGNPSALVKCSTADFALKQCPAASQAGLITVRANYTFYGGSPDTLLGTAPIYSREPGGADTALFGFYAPKVDVPISIPVAVRTSGDYGLRFTVAGFTQTAPLKSADLVFWGFPAKSVHDTQRFPKGRVWCADIVASDPIGEEDVEGDQCLNGSAVRAAIPVRPLIDSPSECTGQPLEVSLRVTTYQDPSHSMESAASYPAVTDCNKMTFEPELQATATTKEADSASGFDLYLTAPQPLGEATTPSPMRAVEVTLPEGFTVNPDAADGQGACLDSQANFDSEGPANCPDQSKIGTFAIGSPALDGPLEGAAYIGQPQPGDQYRIFLIASGFGINAKFVGSLRPDPRTGQVFAEFQGLPQVPFEQFRLHLFASDRGLMATPIRCGLYPVEGRFYPWNTVLPDVRTEQGFSIDSGPQASSCPGLQRPFTPRLVAGTANPRAGAFSAFTLKLDRDDGDQFLGDLNFRLPPGFTGNLRGIAYCPESGIAAAAQNSGRTEQATPSCPAASQIGTTNVAAGPGTHPFHAVGKMYLAGPFRGAPLSLAAVTPALAGPYDYGVVVVRVALHVDPLTAQVGAVSDSVPAIIGGIPIRMRSIQVNIDKPNFTINPTNCAALAVDSQGIGDQGTITDFSSYFHVVNCRTLPFRPKMTIRQVGRRGTHRTKNPELHFELETRAGDANLKALALTLPNAFAIDQRHLGNICSEKELTEKGCAGRTPIGHAATTTPLLDQPLEGPVYAVSGSGGLPKLAFILNGQVEIVPRAETKSIIGKGGAGRLQTTVPVIPDAPIGKFDLTVFGGKSGYLVNTRDLCGKAPVARVSYTAQSGKTYSESSVKIKGSCGKSAAARSHRTG